MKYRCILIFFFLLNISLAQENPISASPMCGWDSLKSNMIYPELMRRAGIEKKVYINFTIDTTGVINNVLFSRENIKSDTASNIFEEVVLRVIKSENWIPKKHHGKSMCDEITLEVDFELISDNYRHFLIVKKVP